MADNGLADALRTTLEGLMKQREQASDAMSKQQRLVDLSAHNLRKAQESESWLRREADNKAEQVSAMLKHINSKPIEERAILQDTIGQLQTEQRRAVDQHKGECDRVREIEDELRKEQFLLEERQGQYKRIVHQIDVLQNDLMEAQR